MIAKHLAIFGGPAGQRRSWAGRSLVFALLWWVLTGGAPDSWLVGVPVILLATRVSITLQPPVSWSLSALLRFIPFFLWHSLCAGIDVARRALDPRLPISPGFYRYRWRLPPGLARVFMANTVSLLPGTLSAELNEDFLWVHLLDKRRAFILELRVIERQVAALFRQSLMPDVDEN